MPDAVDIAQETIEQNLSHTLQNAQRFDTPSNFECECGNQIPEQRRKLGAVKLCIECQTALETKQKHLR
uniref:TraR/DksA C4-type zinc finger protein n=1 Tax=uncultured Acinetobacter sp. TaxID=165433 RepID=UPI00261D4DCE|nr:TraR/DksA C4-type zinc finger protein [uncultured Acinetobacter sp.]